VKRRIPADVPFAVLFSGGIDSTLVAHYARETVASAPGYFLNTAKAPDHPFAMRYAEATGLDLRIVDLDSNPTLERIRRIVSTCESFEPDVVRNTYCTAALAKAAHDDEFRVLLSGEGADELFAGYPPLEASFHASDEIGANLREQHLETMHKSNLQRLDRGGMAWQVEIREPFLDPCIVAYARRLGRDALLAPGPDGPMGKQPLRALYDLYPDSLPAMIRDRRKIPMAEGAGFDESPRSSIWADFAESEISDLDFARRGTEFPGFDIVTKEEQLYLRSLAESLDITRVPHLAARHRLVVPNFPGLRNLSAYLRPIALAS
jgi:asparagine synthase (glutamine-hydrolysing)